MKQPKKVKSVWDNGGESLDRYTIVLEEKTMEGEYNQCIYSCHQPTHPQGISGWSEVIEGDHLGKRITWNELPQAVRKFVRGQLK